MEKKSRINIEVSRQLHTKAKVLSVLNEISMNDYLVEAIKSAILDAREESEEKKK